MSEPVRHHIVPKCYLEAFLNSDQNLYVFQKTKMRDPFESSLNNVAVRRYYYSYCLGTGQFDSRIEKILSNLEGIAKPILSQILLGRMITSQQKEALAIFIGILHTRNPNFRKGTEESLRQLIEVMKDMTIDHDHSFSEIFGDIPDVVIQAAGGHENVREWIKNNFKVSINPDASLEYVGIGISIGAMLSAMRWRFIFSTCRNLPFVTSDNPCYIVNDAVSKTPYGVGLAVKGSKLFLSISPNVCLVADWDGTQIEFKTINDVTKVVRINSRTVRHAESEVYSNIVNKRISEIFNKNREYSFETLIDHIGPFHIARRKLIKRAR